MTGRPLYSANAWWREIRLQTQTVLGTHDIIRRAIQHQVDVGHTDTPRINVSTVEFYEPPLR